MILLETRLSKKLPNYDYSKLSDDKIIIDYIKIIKKRLKIK